jgi:hypothetical protein
VSLFYGFLGELVGEEEILGADCVIPLEIKKSAFTVRAT